MKYKDASNSINGHFAGESVGTRLADSLAPADDGYDYLRGVEHVGTITKDAIDYGRPTPLLLSIEVTAPPTKLQYIVGETLNLAGIAITGSYSGGSVGEIEITADNVMGFNSAEAIASQTLTVTVDGVSDTFDISVVAA